MHTHLADGTVLVMLATVLIAFQRVGLAAAFGGLGVLLIMRAM